MSHLKTLTMASMETNVASGDSFLDKFQTNFTWMDSDKGNRASARGHNVPPPPPNNTNTAHRGRFQVNVNPIGDSK